MSGEHPDLSRSFKNGELARLLYKTACLPGPFEEWFGPSKPLTRKQRWQYKVSDLKHRVKRAWEVLNGRDEDY